MPTTQPSLIPSDALVVDADYLRTLNNSAGGAVVGAINVDVFPTNGALLVSHGVFGVSPDA